MDEITNDTQLELQLLVTGMHLSKEFGLTYKQIEQDGFRINKKVDMDLQSDSPVGISRSIGLGVINISKALADLKPDILVILGDRFEALAAAVAATVARIPIAHLNGGEATEGLIDEAIRHSITKMSYLNFTSMPQYSNPLIPI